MQSHIPHVETAQRLAERKYGVSWRALAKALNYPANYAGVLCDVSRQRPGCIAEEAENILRARLGLAPLYTLEVPPCPDCGAAHTGRCHGRLVTEVAVLTVGESVRRPASGRQRRTCVAIGGLRPETRARLDAARRDAGLTWDAFLAQLA